VSDANTATLGDPDGPVVKRIIGYHGRLVSEQEFEDCSENRSKDS
jgi:hypothetical protein